MMQMQMQHWLRSIVASSPAIITPSAMVNGVEESGKCFMLGRKGNGGRNALLGVSAIRSAVLLLYVTEGASAKNSQSISSQTVGLMQLWL